MILLIQGSAQSTETFASLPPIINVSVCASHTSVTIWITRHLLASYVKLLLMKISFPSSE